MLFIQVVIPQWDYWLHANLFIIWICCYILRFGIPQKQIVIIKPFAIYSCSCLFLSIFSDFSIYQSFKSTISMVASMSGLGLSAALVVNTNKRFNIAVNFFVFIIFLSSIYAVYGFITFQNPYTDFLSPYFPNISKYADWFLHDERGFSFRMTGMFVHPLTLGEFSLLALCFLFIFISRCNRKYRFLYITLIVIQFFCLLLAGSRACILSSFIFLIIYFSSFILKKRKVILTFIVVLTPLVYWGYSRLDDNTKMLIEATIFFFDESASSEINGSSVSMRQGQLRQTFNTDIKNVMFGHGNGYINYLTAANKRDPDMAGYESIVFHKVAEEGLIGLLLYLFLLYKLYSLSVPRHDKLFKREVLSFYLAYLVCIMMTGIQGTGHIFIFECIIFYVYSKTKKLTKLNSK